MRVSNKLAAVCAILLLVSSVSKHDESIFIQSASAGIEQSATSLFGTGTSAADEKVVTPRRTGKISLMIFRHN